jgi:hypothetical protein
MSGWHDSEDGAAGEALMTLFNTLLVYKRDPYSDDDDLSAHYCNCIQKEQMVGPCKILGTVCVMFNTSDEATGRGHDHKDPPPQVSEDTCSQRTFPS